jgi:hypothetical protein
MKSVIHDLGLILEASTLSGFSPDSYGAIPDGVTDCVAAITAADAAANGGYIFLSPGNYRVDANLSISSTLVPSPSGGRLKPASGVTITLLRDPLTPLVQIFDLSLGGKVRFESCPAGGVRAEWWGLKGVIRGVGVQSNAQQTINALAVEAALASIFRGQLTLPPLDIYFNQTVRGLDGDQKGIVGAGDNLTGLYWTIATGAKFVHGSGSDTTYTNENFTTGYRTFRTIRPDSSAATAARFLGNATIAVTNSTPPTLEEAKALAMGEIWWGAANPTIRNVVHADDLIGFYWKHTTTVGGEQAWAVRTFSEQFPDDVFIGHYLEGRGASVGATSMNGSWDIRHPVVIAAGFAGLSYGFVLDGRPSTAAATGDIRDWLPTAPETASCSVGILIVSSGTLDTDVHIKNPVLDICRQNGVIISGLGAEGVVMMSDVHINGGTGCGQLAYVNACDGVVEILGDWDGGAGYATVVGAYIHQSNKVVVGGRFINCLYSVLGDGASQGCTVARSTHDNYPGHNGIIRVYLEAGCVNWDIERQILDGNCTTGIQFDAGANTNTYRNPKTLGAYTNIVADHGSGNTAFG